MKTGAFIAVRTGSSRLPAKALLPILGKPMIERMKASGRIMLRLHAQDERHGHSSRPEPPPRLRSEFASGPQSLSEATLRTA